MEVLHDGDGGNGLDFLVGDHLRGKEFECPVVCPFRRIGAGKGNEVLFRFVVEFAGLTGTGIVGERRREAAPGKARADALDGSGARVDARGNGNGRSAARTFHEDTRTGRHPCIVISALHDMLYVLPLSGREFDDMLLVFHIPQYITKPYVRQD